MGDAEDRLPRRPHQGDPRGVRGAPGCDAGRLERYFPEGCSWTHPEGGLFLWARVPEWLDTEALLREAVEAKVAFVPGFAFYTDPQRGRNTMRLNFSNAQPEQIEDGIRQARQAAAGEGGRARSYHTSAGVGAGLRTCTEELAYGTNARARYHDEPCARDWPRRRRCRLLLLSCESTASVTCRSWRMVGWSA